MTRFGRCRTNTVLLLLELPIEWARSDIGNVLIRVTSAVIVDTQDAREVYDKALTLPEVLGKQAWGRWRQET